MDKKKLLALSLFLKIPTASNGTSKLQFLLLCSWSIIGIYKIYVLGSHMPEMLIEKNNYMEIILYMSFDILIAIFFMVIHFLLWNFPLKTRSINVFLVIQLIFLIGNIILWALNNIITGEGPSLLVLMLMVSFYYGMLIFILPFSIIPLVQVLKYRKALKLQLTQITN